MWANMAVILLAGIVLQQTNAELNLNFQQHDYQIKLVRGELVHYNKQYIKDASVVTFKHNRTITAINGTLTPKVDLGNDIEGIIQGYKFMSNEYRFFPMHFSANCCKMFAANVGGVKSGLARCGNVATGCLLRKGVKYIVCNWYPDQSKFPPFIPNGEYKIEIQLLIASQEIFVANVYGVVSRPIV